MTKIDPSQIDSGSASDGQVMTYSSATGLWSPASIGSNSYAAKAWVNFDGTRDAAGNSNFSATNRYLYASYNISSVKIATATTGIYIVSFGVPLSNTDYVVTGTASLNSTNTYLGTVGIHNNYTANQAPSATGFYCCVFNAGAGSTVSCNRVSLIVF